MDLFDDFQTFQSRAHVERRSATRDFIATFAVKCENNDRPFKFTGTPIISPDGLKITCRVEPVDEETFELMKKAEELDRPGSERKDA